MQITLLSSRDYVLFCTVAAGRCARHPPRRCTVELSWVLEANPLMGTFVIELKSKPIEPFLLLR